MPEKIVEKTPDIISWKCRTCGKFWTGKHHITSCKNPACGEDCCEECGKDITVLCNGTNEPLASLRCHKSSSCEGSLVELLGLIDEKRILRIIRRQYRKDNKQEQDESGPAGIDAENQE